ncbi:MAG: nucleoside 2-deoxyribosyltransferase [Deltaproteobacteria bacterium]|nr:nucleoside 2-deoxyribosyltransferase [Deltaproteobacteria bacterium]
MKIYVASSWRNQYQPGVVEALRASGHEVYDFRNPPGRTGFAWSDIDPDWQNWNTEQYIEALRHPVAIAGFNSDMDALRACDAVVLVLPSGRSAALEAGWACGAGKPVYVYQPEPCEPELMLAMCNRIFRRLETVITQLMIDHLDLDLIDRLDEAEQALDVPETNDQRPTTNDPAP